jgi:hypothetical protein
MQRTDGIHSDAAVLNFDGTQVVESFFVGTIEKVEGIPEETRENACR